MNSAKKFLDISKTLQSFSKLEWGKIIVSSSQLGCHNCLVLQRRLPAFTRQSRFFHSSLQRLYVSSSSPLSSEASAKNRPWVLDECVSPQGIQGSDEQNDPQFRLWLENCNRFGLSNCDQQLEGIQTGRKTIGEVIAEQEKLIAEIAEEYRRQNAKRGEESMGMEFSLPDLNMTCPQGVQGDDCARFKLWLENCHHFQFRDCAEQLNSYTQGRKTLAQIFEQQDQMIREAAQVMYQRRAYSTTQEGNREKPTGNTSQTNDQVKNDDGVEQPPVQLTSRQKLKNAVAVYGSTVIVFHVSISLMSLGFFYTLVSSGIDVVGILTKLGIGESIVQSKLATGTGTFVVAYAVHKVFAPARIAATLTATPLIVRYLRRIGFLKTPVKK